MEAGWKASHQLSISATESCFLPKYLLYQSSPARASIRLQVAAGSLYLNQQASKSLAGPLWSLVSLKRNQQRKTVHLRLISAPLRTLLGLSSFDNRRHVQRAVALLFKCMPPCWSGRTAPEMGVRRTASAPCSLRPCMMSSIAVCDPALLHLLKP